MGFRGGCCRSLFLRTFGVPHVFKSHQVQCMGCSHCQDINLTFLLKIFIFFTSSCQRSTRCALMTIACDLAPDILEGFPATSLSLRHTQIFRSNRSGGWCNKRRESWRSLQVSQFYCHSCYSTMHAESGEVKGKKTRFYYIQKNACPFHWHGSRRSLCDGGGGETKTSFKGI